MDYEAKRTEILKQVQAELDALQAEYDPLLEAAERNVSELEAEIKNDVLLGGESVMTDVYQALYMRGRVTWDTEGIDKYAVAHPEVLKYRKQGQPNVTLRKGR
jgi:prefoldin subunit 5